MVSPEVILKELSELWVSLGKQDEAGVLRACAMTMIVAAEESADTQAITETIGELMHDHPSRAIVLRVKPSSEPLLESRVFAQCWMPFGRRQQICCEQIEIVCSEVSLADVPRVILGLIAPDLPVVLICRSPRLFSLPAFEQMLTLSHRVIVDSEDSTDPLELLRQIRAAKAIGMRVHDLAWTRLTQYREAIAAEFDLAECRSHWRRLRSAQIVHAAGTSRPEAWYLGAWLAETAGVLVAISQGSGTAAIESVEILGDGIRLAIERGAGSTLQVALNSHAKKIPFVDMNDWDLLREELSITGHDRTFDRILPRAIALAEGRS